MRYAIYYSPPQQDPLTRTASRWLGRCAFSGDSVAQPAVTGLSAKELFDKTAAARRYGFHATLMAPFELAEDKSEDQLIASLDKFCDGLAPVQAPPLVVGQLDGFFALVPQQPDDGLNQFAADVVQAFEPFRAPLSDAEMVRRGGPHLSVSQQRNLVQWGYPHLFEDFRFHMTLTDRIPADEAAYMRAAINDHFGSTLGQPVELASLALFLEPERGGPFIIRSFHEFQPSCNKRTA